jgi:hypothetical protein
MSDQGLTLTDTVLAPYAKTSSDGG